MSMSELDPGQIIKHAYDDALEAIRVTGNITTTPAAGAATEAKQDAGNASLASIDGKITVVDTSDVSVTNTVTVSATNLDIRDLASGTDSVSAVQSGTWNITNVSGTVSLPTGAATEATLSSLNGKVTAINTGNVTVSSSALPTGAATETTLSSLNGKVVAVDTANVTIINAAGAAAINIQDGGNSITVDGSVSAVQSGTWNVNNVSGTVSLPTGASTAANQTTANSSLSSIDGKITAVNTGAVVVSSSALPSGASTSALQTTGNTSVASIDTKTPALGQALAAASTPVVLTAAQITTLTPPTSVTVTQATGTNLHVAVDSLPAIPAGANAIGSVTVSNFPATQPVSGTVAATQSGTWSTRTQDGSGNAITSTASALDVNLKSSGVTLTVNSNLDVIDFIDTTPVLDTSSTNIPASASNPVSVVASLAANVKKIKINDTCGQFVGVYTGAALSEVLQCVVGPGEDGVIEVAMASGERVSLRNMANSTISSGSLCIQFLG